MRIIEDISVFTTQKARMLNYRQEYSSYESGRYQGEKIVFKDKFLESQMLYSTYVGRSDLRDYYFQRRRRQNFLSIEYIYSGEIYIKSGNNGYIAEAGDLCLLHPGMDNSLLFTGEKRCRKLGIVIKGRALSETLRTLQIDHLKVINFPDHKRIDEVVDQIGSNLLKAMDRSACEKLVGSLFEFLQFIANMAKCQPIPEIITNIQNFFEKHYAENLNMKQIATEFDMSIPTMNKRFSDALNMTPYQYLIQLRMHKASCLLTEDKLNIKEIAAMVGYNSPLHFSTEFRRIHGCSPRHYRIKLNMV